MTTPVAAWGADAYRIDSTGPVIPQFMDFALAQLVAEYTAQGIELPARQYWTVGQEALDCEQVALTAQSAILGTAGAPVALSRCSGPKALSLNVQIVRCTPVAGSRNKAPTGASIQASAVPVATDMDILLFDFPQRLDVYDQGILASVTAVSAEGGLHGALGSYTVTL